MAEESSSVRPGGMRLRGAGALGCIAHFAARVRIAGRRKYTKPVPSVSFSFRLAILWALPALV
jgi:hypothetical protein